MVVIEVADYAQFKAVVAMLSKGKPAAHVMFVQEAAGFTVVGVVDGAAISVPHKLAERPATFDTDFRDAVAITGINFGN